MVNIDPCYLANIENRGSLLSLLFFLSADEDMQALGGCWIG